MNRNRDTIRLRTLAHQLKVNLETERRLPSTVNPVPLYSRLSQVLDTAELWVRASGLEAEDSGRIHARAQRDGIGRKYTEELVMTLQKGHLSLVVTRWVREANQGYYAGSWNFQEDLRTGTYHCKYSS